jgi:transcriptional regulator with XRE-family HTH domain
MQHERDMLMSVSTSLRTEREAKGLSLRELAYFAGCSASNLSRLERGLIDVAPATKARIARALQVPLQILFPLDRAA